MRLDVDLGADVSMPLPPTSGSSIAISPDGTRLAYASGNPTRLFVRRLDQSTATELPGTQGAAVPLFSPDGHWVGFVAGTKLNKVSVEGGAAVAIGDVAGSHVSGAHWGEESGILVSEAFGNRGCSAFPPAEVRPRPSWDWAAGNSPSRSRGCCPEARRSCLPPTPRWTWTRSRSRSSRSAIARGRSWPEVDTRPGICRRRAGPAIWSTPTGQRSSRSRSTWRRSRRAGRPCASWTMSPTTR